MEDFNLIVLKKGVGRILKGIETVTNIDKNLTESKVKKYNFEKEKEEDNKLKEKEEVFKHKKIDHIPLKIKRFDIDFHLCKIKNKKYKNNLMIIKHFKNVDKKIVIIYDTKSIKKVGFEFKDWAEKTRDFIITHDINDELKYIEYEYEDIKLGVELVYAYKKGYFSKKEDDIVGVSLDYNGNIKQHTSKEIDEIFGEAFILEQYKNQYGIRQKYFKE